MNIQRNQLSFKGLVELKLPGEMYDNGKTTAIVNTDNLLLKGEVSNSFSGGENGTRVISNGKNLAFFKDKSPAEIAKKLGIEEPIKQIDLSA